MRLVALKYFRYAEKHKSPGDVFVALSEKDFFILQAIGHARRADDDEPVKPTRGRYRRADMRAEE